MESFEDFPAVSGATATLPAPAMPRESFDDFPAVSTPAAPAMPKVESFDDFPAVTAPPSMPRESFEDFPAVGAVNPPQPAITSQPAIPAAPQPPQPQIAQNIAPAAEPPVPIVTPQTATSIEARAARFALANNLPHISSITGQPIDPNLSLQQEVEKENQSNQHVQQMYEQQKRSTAAVQAWDKYLDTVPEIGAGTSEETVGNQIPQRSQNYQATRFSQFLQQNPPPMHLLDEMPPRLAEEYRQRLRDKGVAGDLQYTTGEQVGAETGKLPARGKAAAAFLADLFNVKSDEDVAREQARQKATELYGSDLARELAKADPTAAEKLRESARKTFEKFNGTPADLGGKLIEFGSGTAPFFIPYIGPLLGGLDIAGQAQIAAEDALKAQGMDPREAHAGGLLTAAAKGAWGALTAYIGMGGKGLGGVGKAAATGGAIEAGSETIGHIGHGEQISPQHILEAGATMGLMHALFHPRETGEGLVRKANELLPQTPNEPNVIDWNNPAQRQSKLQGVQEGLPKQEQPPAPKTPPPVEGSLPTQKSEGPRFAGRNANGENVEGTLVARGQGEAAIKDDNGKLHVVPIDQLQRSDSSFQRSKQEPQQIPHPVFGNDELRRMPVAALRRNAERWGLTYQDRAGAVRDILAKQEEWRNQQPAAPAAQERNNAVEQRSSNEMGQQRGGDQGDGAGEGGRVQPSQQGPGPAGAIAPQAPKAEEAAPKVEAPQASAPSDAGVKEPWQMTKAQWLKSNRTIDKPAVYASGQIFTGTDHGDAAQKAIDAGALRREGDRLVDAKTGDDFTYSGAGDLFTTTDGGLVDRLKADKEYNVNATENIDRRFAPHREAVETALSEGKPVRPEVLKDYPDLQKQAETPTGVPNEQHESGRRGPLRGDRGEGQGGGSGQPQRSGRGGGNSQIRQGENGGHGAEGAQEEGQAQEQVAAQSEGNDAGRTKPIVGSNVEAVPQPPEFSIDELSTMDLRRLSKRHGIDPRQARQEMLSQLHGIEKENGEKFGEEDVRAEYPKPNPLAPESLLPKPEKAKSAPEMTMGEAMVAANRGERLPDEVAAKYRISQPPENVPPPLSSMKGADLIRTARSEGVTLTGKKTRENIIRQIEEHRTKGASNATESPAATPAEVSKGVAATGEQPERGVHAPATAHRPRPGLSAIEHEAPADTQLYAYPDTVEKMKAVGKKMKEVAEQKYRPPNFKPRGQVAVRNKVSLPRVAESSAEIMAATGDVAPSSRKGQSYRDAVFVDQGGRRAIATDGGSLYVVERRAHHEPLATDGTHLVAGGEAPDYSADGYNKEAKRVRDFISDQKMKNPERVIVTDPGELLHAARRASIVAGDGGIIIGSDHGKMGIAADNSETGTVEIGWRDKTEPLAVVNASRLVDGTKYLARMAGNDDIHVFITDNPSEKNPQWQVVELRAESSNGTVRVFMGAEKAEPAAERANRLADEQSRNAEHVATERNALIKQEEARKAQVAAVEAAAAAKRAARTSKAVAATAEQLPPHIQDVTPEGYGPSMDQPDYQPNTEYRDTQDWENRRTTEEKRLINSINEGQTILRGKVAGEKRAAIERDIARAKEKLAALEAKRGPRPLSASEIEQEPGTPEPPAKADASPEGFADYWDGRKAAYLGAERQRAKEAAMANVVSAKKHLAEAEQSGKPRVLATAKRVLEGAERTAENVLAGKFDEENVFVAARARAEQAFKQQAESAAVTDIRHSAEPPKKFSKEWAQQNLDRIEHERQETLKKLPPDKRRSRGSSILEPEQLFYQGVIAAHDIAKKAKDFAAWSKAMIERLGEAIKPHLPTLWEHVRPRTPEETATGIKNAQVDLERLQRNLPPAMQAARRGFGRVWDEAMKEVEVNPAVQDDLLRELKNKPRALTDREDALLLHKQIQLQNDFHNTAEALVKAHADKDQAGIVQNRIKSAALSDQLLDLYNVNKSSGTETGRGLNARRMLANEDFSLAAMETRKRAANEGRELTPEEKAGIQDLHGRIEKTQKALDEHTQRATDERAQLEFQHARAEINSEVKQEAASDRQAGRVRDIPAERKRIVASMDEAVKKGALPTDLRSYIRALARNFVASGITEREPLLDAVHGEVNKIVPEMSRRRTMDAISGYGDFKALSKDEIDVKLRDLKGQMQQVGKLEDMSAGQAPLKTGVERRAVSDEERRLIQQVNETKKRLGIQSVDPETQLKSALDSIKTRLGNQIKDLEYQIATGTKIVKDKSQTPKDAEALKLEARRDELKKQYDSIFGKSEMSDEQRLKLASDAVEKQIADLERRIRERDLFPDKKPSKVPPSDALNALRARRDALGEQLQQLKDLDVAHQEKTKETQLAHEINRLQKRIDEGKVAAPELKATADSLQVDQLKKQKAAMLEQMRKMREAAAGSGPQDAKKQETLQKSIADLERRIANNDLATRNSAKPTADSRETMELKQRQQELRKQLTQLRNEARPRKTEEEIALQTTKTRLKSNIADLAEKIAAGDFAKRTPRAVALDAEGLRLKAENERLKDIFQRDLVKDQLKQRSKLEKAQDAWVGWRRMSLLSGPRVILKLMAAGTERMAITPAEEVLGYGFSKIIPGVASRAPREGGLSVRAEAKALTEGIMTGIKEVPHILRTGKSRKDLLFGDETGVPRSWMDFAGTLHKVMKSPAVENEFSRAFQKRTENAIVRGLDVTDPLVQDRLMAEAYPDAQRAIFMQNNKLASGVKRFAAALTEKNKETGKPTVGGKLGATALKTALPILRVPLNIVAETMQYATGTVSGSVRLARAYASGIENLKPHEADIIMRSLKKGSLGLAVMALGFFNADRVGGYYQPGQQRDREDVKAGRVRVFGHDIPSFLLHNPLLECLQIGATVRRVADSRLRKKDLETQGIGSGALAAAMGLAEETPFVRELPFAEKLLDPAQRDKALSREGAELITPQLSKFAAEQTDKDAQGNPTRRTPEGTLENIKMGIPGLRQQVPKEQIGNNTTAEKAVDIYLSRADSERKALEPIVLKKVLDSSHLKADEQDKLLQQAGIAPPPDLALNRELESLSKRASKEAQKKEEIRRLLQKADARPEEAAGLTNQAVRIRDDLDRMNGREIGRMRRLSKIHEAIRKERQKIEDDPNYKAQGEQRIRGLAKLAEE